eukprot:Skav204257  [mRNA]  locus=scaffold912:153114:162178:- [translate_table: standard]
MADTMNYSWHQKHAIGIAKESMNVAFTVRDFSYIFATHSRELATGLDPRSVEELTVNSVSSNDVLRAGPYSFRISIGWSLGRDMSVQAHSMLGVAVERWGPRHRFGEKSVVMSTEAPLGIGERGRGTLGSTGGRLNGVRWVMRREGQAVHRQFHGGEWLWRLWVIVFPSQ